MKTHAQAVVIGGGLIGCSILYHLTKLGWSDVVLLERDELTSGSTWHAAANIHGLHDHNNISKMQYYTMKIYKEIEEETGQGCGIFHTGSLYLAQTEEREHQLLLQEAKARYFDVDFYKVARDEAEQLHPLVNFDGIRCIMYEPDGGSVDPSGVTQAYAAGAKLRGAEVHRFTPVTATLPQPDGSWIVETPKGNIHTQWVVNAAGLWGREVASLAGLELPLQPTEHQYFVTDNIPEIEAMDKRLPSVADRDGEYYLRQEAQGLLIGAYEKDVKLWAEEGTPSNFGHDLFDGDLERIEENLMRAIDRVPVVGEAGIKRIINGPMIWSPDSSALFGSVPELSNYFCCNGIIPGFSQSGGLGLMAAQWIIEGEPEYDMFPWDIARYDDWANKKFTKERVIDQYQHRFKIHFPFEEREAGRPAMTRPAYDRQKELGAVFGLNAGWEHPLWFAPKGVEPTETYGFKRQAWFDHVGAECIALRDSVGVIDVSNFAKYEIRGVGAEEWLNKIIANKVPSVVGRTCLTPLMSVRGGIAGDFTLTKLDDEHFFMIGSGMAERYHQRFFQAVPRPDSVSFVSKTRELCGFNIAGPKSRELLSRLTQEDMSTANWSFMRSKRLVIAGIEATALRVSFTGDLGWEFYVDTENQLKLYDALLSTGEDLNVRPVGSRALMSLRTEKGYGSWSREYSPEYWPHEVQLDRLIKLEKGDFLNKEAFLRVQKQPPREQLVIIEVTDIEDADASGSEPIFLPDGTPIGRVTSGAYGYTVEKSLALAMIKTEHAAAGQAVDVAILGRPHRGVILAEPPFDPQGEILRG